MVECVYCLADWDVAVFPRGKNIQFNHGNATYGIFFVGLGDDCVDSLNDLEDPTRDRYFNEEEDDIEANEEGDLFGSA